MEDQYPNQPLYDGSSDDDLKQIEDKLSDLSLEVTSNTVI